MAKRWRVAVAMVATVAACAPALHTPDVGDDPLSWEDVRRGGLGDARFAVLVSPYPDKAAGNGRVGLVSPDGATRWIDLEMAAGPIDGRPGVLCAATRSTMLTITATGAARRPVAGGVDGWGGWTRARADGTCTWRGWTNGVTWTHDGRVMSASAAALSTGSPVIALSTGTMWVRDGDESALESPVRLTSVDLRTGRTASVAHWSNLIERTGDRRLVAETALTSLFWHGGRVHWLEEVVAYVGEEDEGADIRPGVGAEAHLASVDPRTGRREVTHLLDTRNGLHQSPEEPDRTEPAAWALASGHLHEGTIYTGNGNAEIIAIDLATRTTRVVGALSARSRTAPDVVAAWRGETLSLLMRDESEVVVEDYDLTTGALTASTTLRGLEGVLDDRTYLASAAIVG